MDDPFHMDSHDVSSPRLICSVAPALSPLPSPPVRRTSHGRERKNVATLTIFPRTRRFGVTPADLAILEADHWFGHIPVERRALLLDQAHVRSVGAGMRLYGAGDPPNGLWAVLDGRVQLKGYPAPGLELLVPILSPGTWFGETSTLDGLPRPTDAAALEAARVLHVSMAAFARAAEAAPKLYHDVGVLACQHQRVALGFIAQTVAHPARVRLALLLAGQSGGGQEVVRIRQEDLAMLVGVSRQTLNRHLNVLEREGIIGLAYAAITVRDLPRLLALTPKADVPPP